MILLCLRGIRRTHSWLCSHTLSSSLYPNISFYQLMGREMLMLISNLACKYKHLSCNWRQWLHNYRYGLKAQALKKVDSMSLVLVFAESLNNMKAIPTCISEGFWDTLGLSEAKFCHIKIRPVLHCCLFLHCWLQNRFAGCVPQWVTRAYCPKLDGLQRAIVLSL